MPTPPMTRNDHESGRLVGDYRLEKLLNEEGHITTWLAEQVSVGRLVLLDELRDFSGANREHFLADSRARAAVDHPFIASVYEAGDAAGHCFRATERLPDATLHSLLDARKTMEPARLSHVLRCLAEANLHHETNGRPTLPLTPSHIHVDGNQTARIANLAIAGHRDEENSARDVSRLGRDLIPLVPSGRPGSTRLLTLLAWMRGKERPAPLRWQEIISLCDQIDHQLAAPVVPVLSTPKPGPGPLLLVGVGALAGLVAIAAVVAMLGRDKPKAVRELRLPPVLVPTGEYPTHGTTVAGMRAFLIDARETTISEYHEFLETLAVLETDDRQRVFDHPEQPPEKTNHVPDDWDALLAAARARQKWKNHAVSLNSPVVGVDWWDAMAYANWRKARLPTSREWAAAVHHQCGNPAEIPAGPWHAEPPDTCPDRTPAGLLGVAGSLREWTRELSINPANPLGRPQHVIVGGSHRTRHAHAMTREWVVDPMLRRIDLGFRLVRDVPDDGQ